MKKSIFNPSKALKIFWAATESAVFDQQSNGRSFAFVKMPILYKLNKFV